MSTRRSLINFSSLLFCIIPFALLTGPFLPDLFLSIISLIFLIISIKEKLWRYYKNNFFYIFILFYSYLILNSLFSDLPIEALKNIIFYFRFGIFSLAVWYMLENNNRLIKIFTVSLVITFIIAMSDGLYQFFFDTNIFGLKAIGIRTTLLLNDRMILGGYLSRLFPLLIALLIYNYYNKNNFNKLLFIFLFLTTPIIIYLTGERTALGLIFVQLIVMIILLPGLKFLKVFAIPTSFIIIIFITLYSPEIKDRNINHTLDQFNIIPYDYNSKIIELNEGTIVNNKKIRFFSIDHDRLFRSSFKMFQQNKLFGVGPGLFRNFCNNEEYSIDENSCSTHPHNTYLQVLAETGLFGVFFILIIFFFTAYKLVETFILKFLNKKYSISDYQICLLICFIISLWPLFPTQNIFNNWINIIYFLPVGFYLQSIKSYKF